MKAQDLIGKTKDELKKMLLDMKKQQFNFRFQLSQGQLENTAEVRKNRRDVARVKTFLNMDESSAPKPAPKPKTKKTTDTKTTTKKPAAKKTVKKTAAKKKAA